MSGLFDEEDGDCSAELTVVKGNVKDIITEVKRHKRIFSEVQKIISELKADIDAIAKLEDFCNEQEKQLISLSAKIEVLINHNSVHIDNTTVAGDVKGDLTGGNKT